MAQALTQALTLALAAGLILFAGWGFTHETKAAKAYTPTNLMRQSQEAVPADKPVAISPDKVVRLHVRGNSNDVADQGVKLAVRDAIMASFGKTLETLADGHADSHEAERVLSSSLSEIEKVSVECLQENGFTYGAKAALKLDRFPERWYDTASGARVFLPAGEYRALVVDLGKGEGDNWWCVMYPPLCYFDLVQRAVLKYGGTDASPDAASEVALIVDELSTKEVPVEVRSLLLDTLRAGMKKLAEFLTKVRPGTTSASDAP